MWEFASAALPVVGQIGGAYLTSKSNDRATDKNIAIQRELAKEGLSWRVADAKKAGINPLAALGASLPSGNPVAVGTDYGDLGLGAAGQEISRAMQARMTKEQREMHELNKRLLTVQIEGQEIENRNKMTGTPPPLPINPSPSLPLSSADFPFEGNKNSGVKIVPNEIKASGQPGVEAGSVPMYQFGVNNKGEGDHYLSKDMAELMEADTFLWGEEQLRRINQVTKSWVSGLTSKMGTEKFKKAYAQELVRMRPKHPKKGWEYRYDLLKMKWIPMPIKNGRSYIYVTPLKDQSGIRFPIPRR